MAIQTVAKGAVSLGAPINADDIQLLGGSAVINQSNLDWSSVAAAATVIVPYDFNGSLGSVTTPFVANVSSFFEYNASGGDCYWTSDGSASDTSARLIQRGNGHMHLVGSVGLVTSAEVFGGSFTVAASTAFTNGYFGGGATIRVYDVGTDPTLIRNEGATVFLWRGATTINHDAGATHIMSEVSGNTITTLNIHGAGVHIDNTGGANITNCNCYGGIPNTARLAQAFTIDNTILNLSLQGARDFENHPLITHSSVTYIGGR